MKVELVKEIFCPFEVEPYSFFPAELGFSINLLYQDLSPECLFSFTYLHDELIFTKDLNIY